MKIVFIVLVIFFTGCSQRDVTNTLDNSMASIAGNKPPSTFKFLDHTQSNGARFNFKEFEILLPLAKADDWVSMGGWYGSSSTDYFWETLHIKPAGHKGGSWVSYYFKCRVTTTKYDDFDEAVEKGDIKSVKARIGGNASYIKRMGKENYPCIVHQKEKFAKKIQTYTCYKSSPDKKEVKQVHMRFVYTFMPKTPKEYRGLKYKYNFEDLVQRAQRSVNSLYIKDGW